MSKKLNELTIEESIRGLKENRFSVTELVQSSLDRINEIDNKINAFITVCENKALDEAKKKDKTKLNDHDIKKLFGKYPLFGIPIAVKDIFCTKGIKTTAASNILKDYLPVYNATVVQKLEDAGAIIIGKTNLDSFCHGSSTETSDFFTTKNPWNLDCLPGGSSGGSAAAVAAGMCVAAIGTETAGSIRQPAAWCGVVGLKPTYGRVSRYGVIAMASSFDSPGPITKSVSDAAICMQVLAGKDNQDATTLFQKPTDYLKNIEKGVKGTKIGLPKEYFLKNSQLGINSIVLEAVKKLEKLGAKIIPLSLIDPKYAVSVYTILQRSEVSSNLGRFDGIRYGQERDYFNTENKNRIMLGTYTLSAGYYDAYYLRAQKVRTLIINDFQKAFKQVDLIVAPTSPCTALPLNSSKDQAMFGELQDILLEPSSIAGLTGINLVCSFINNLPVGMQIIGPQLKEDLVLRAGYAYEKSTDWHLHKPNIKYE